VIADLSSLWPLSLFCYSNSTYNFGKWTTVLAIWATFLLHMRRIRQLSTSGPNLNPKSVFLIGCFCSVNHFGAVTNIILDMCGANSGLQCTLLRMRKIGDVYTSGPIFNPSI